MSVSAKKIDIQLSDTLVLCADLHNSEAIPEESYFDVWFEWIDDDGKQHDNKVETNFDCTGDDAIALRDFLIYCFPLDK